MQPSATTRPPAHHVYANVCFCEFRKTTFAGSFVDSSLTSADESVVLISVSQSTLATDWGGGCKDFIITLKYRSTYCLSKVFFQAPNTDFAERSQRDSTSTA